MPINYGAPINPLQFHPTPHAHIQPTNAGNRNENQTNLLINNHQMRNNSMPNENDKIKLPPANQTQGVRPVSRGDLASQRAQNNLVQNQQHAFQIQNDQQTFQLPPGSLPGSQAFSYTGGPNSVASMSNGFQQQQQNANNNMQPQIHFIANQQKFYAQISPDKAPLLFSEKRPFSTAIGGGDIANNIMMQNGIIAASSNIMNAQPQPTQQQERANSKHGSSSKTGRLTNGQKSNSTSGGTQLNPMPYLQMASKTHTGSFGLHQMQQIASQQQSLMSNYAPKYVSSTGQLDIQSQQQQSNHLASIFQQQQQPKDVKISKIMKPGKNNIKEKEQLYEDAIKLKIQSNSYREENIKLKTKIKILENEMQKKEKAMEEFIGKMQINQITGGVVNNGVGSAHQSGSMFYQQLPNSKHQMPANINGVTSNNPIINPQPTQQNLLFPLNNNFMQSQANNNPSSSQKFQSDTFLVMSLKKQLKDAKLETQKKEEELEILKKNIKTTQKVEIEVEMKTYQDELQRMRFLMEELMKEGPNHPIYQKHAQEKIRMLEGNIQQQEYMMAQLRQDNTDLANLLRQREEDQTKKKEDKDKKVEMKNELIKVKKTLGEKNREVVKLKQDINNLRKQIGGIQQNSTEQSSNTNTNGGINGNISTHKTEETPITKKESSNTTASSTTVDTQLKTLQKKHRDLLADNKTKKDKLEEQDGVIKKLQERLQQKLDELTNEQNKYKTLQEELTNFKKVQEQKDLTEKKITDISNNYKKEIEFILCKSRSNNISHDTLVKNLEKHVSPPKLLESLKGLTKDQIKRVLPIYTLYTQSQKIIYQQLASEVFLSHKTAFLENCDLELQEDSDEFIKYSEFEDVLQSMKLKVDEDLLQYMKIEYFKQVESRKGWEFEIGFLFKKMIEDIEKVSNSGKTTAVNGNERVQSAASNKRARPQTAKSNQSSQQKLQQKSGNDLNQIDEEEKDTDDKDVDDVDDYEDDFEEQKLSVKKKEQVKQNDIEMINKSKSKAADKSKDTIDKAKVALEVDKSVDDSDSDTEEKKDKEPTPAKQQQTTILDQQVSNKLDDDDLLSSGKKVKKQSNSFDAGAKKDSEERKETNGDVETSEIKRFMDEEEMLDIAEHCFIRVAEMLLEKNITTRSVFTKYSVPEQFPDGTILELMSPIAFLEGVKEAGMEELSEMEAACLLRVLAKPELDNAIILNEFIMIMENFGVVDAFEDDDDDDDYIRTEDELSTITDHEQSKSQLKDTDAKNDEVTPANRPVPTNKQPIPKKKKKIQINFDLLEEKGLKILRKLARFLLERYLHPREFFGPAIYKQLVKTKKRENNVDILQTKDFYLRLKIAGIRKTVKEVENLNTFLCLDAKFPHLMQVKKVIKALEEVAQGEQMKLQEEMIKKQEEMLKKGGGIVEEAKEEDEEDDGDIGEDEKKAKKLLAQEKSAKLGNNSDLIRETGSGLGLLPHSALTGGPSGYMGSMGGGYDYSMMRGAGGAPPSKIQMLMGFNHLNTIEEEKHETQNSAYFRDGDESHRDADQSNLMAKGSRILDDLYNSHSNKVSPDRQDNFKEEEEDNYDEEVEEEDNDKQEKDDDKDEYEEDDDDDGAVPADDNKSIKDMKSVQSAEEDNDNYDDDFATANKKQPTDDLNESIEDDTDNKKDDTKPVDKIAVQSNIKDHVNANDDDDYHEEESDYEI